MKKALDKKMERILERMRMALEGKNVEKKQQGDDREVNLLAMMIAAFFTCLPVEIAILAIIFSLIS